MSVTGRVGIGLPVVLLYEAEGLTITIETRTGDMYRGILIQTEDSMNCFLRNVTHTDFNGNEKKLEQCYLRGKCITFIILPDFISKSPMFKRVQKHKETKGRFVPQGTGIERARQMLHSRQSGLPLGAGIPGGFNVNQQVTGGRRT